MSLEPQGSKNKDDDIAKLSISDGSANPFVAKNNPNLPCDSFSTQKFQVVKEDLYLHYKVRKQIEDLKYQNNFNGSSTLSISTNYKNYLINYELQVLGITPKNLKNDQIFSDSSLDKKLQNELIQRSYKPQFISMKLERQKLPAYQQQKTLIKTIENNQVVLVVGDTGCGKTTQVPQYILDYFIESGKASLCKIVCTQPRKISAIGVAHRVATERCIQCGNHEIGYHVRLDSKKPRNRGSILFCTTGIIMLHLQSNPLLKGISHIIVDEVHERDMLTDFFLMNLKNIVTLNKNLKVILMSATVNADLFSRYFDDCPKILIPGRMFPVQVFTLEDMIQKTNFRLQINPNNKKKVVQKKPDPAYEKEKNNYLKTLGKKYSATTISTLHKFNEDELNIDLIAECLKTIAVEEKDGSILVFLPGWQEIKALLSKIDKFFPKEGYLLIPLHSGAPNSYHKQALEKAPLGKQKIILSTNIAETSITIDDCVAVIDSAKFKMKSFDPITKMHILQPQWVALSNAAQRKGRAGRTRPGTCYHMFTKVKEKMLDEFQVPEMQRNNLEDLILNIKILHHCKVSDFLQTAISPPKPEAVQISLRTLYELNAITADEQLTALGFLLAKLPVDVQIGKLLILGAIFSCLDPITTIAACLSFKDPFKIPLWESEQDSIREAKLNLAYGTQSDHMLFAFSMDMFTTHGSREFCKKYYLSPGVLEMLLELKSQFGRYLEQLCFIKTNNIKDEDCNVNSENELLIKALFCAATYPNIVKVCPRENENILRPP